MRLWGVSQTARELGVSTFSIRRLIKSGELKAVNVGARILIPGSELARVAAEGCGKRRSRKARLPQDGGF